MYETGKNRSGLAAFILLTRGVASVNLATYGSVMTTSKPILLGPVDDSLDGRGAVVRVLEDDGRPLALAGDLGRELHLHVAEHAGLGARPRR